MRYLKILTIALAISLLMVGYQFAESNETKTMSQQICPVMNFGDIGCSVTKNDIYTDYQGKRIYFCSKGCREIFKKDPEKHINKLENKGMKLQEVPRAERRNKSKPGTGSECKQRGFAGCCGDWGCF